VSELLTAALAVATGVVVFVVGQYFVRLVIEPVSELRKAIARVNYLMLYYANKMYSPSEDAEYVKKELRESASRLLELVHIPALYRFIYGIFDMPSAKDIENAIPLIIGLSNNVGEKTPDDPKYVRIEEIRKLLKLSKPNS